MLNRKCFQYKIMFKMFLTHPDLTKNLPFLIPQKTSNDETLGSL